MTDALQRTLRALWVEYGLQELNMAYVNMLTTMETQLKELRSPPVLPKPQTVVLTNTIDTPTGPKVVVKKTTPSVPVPAPAPVPALASIPEKVTDEKKMADLNKRKIHKETVAKRKELLEGQGINGRQMLTQDAIKKWLDEGKTYWDIAEQTGVPDADISVLAKSFGLQSKVSKKYWSKK